MDIDAFDPLTVLSSDKSVEGKEVGLSAAKCNLASAYVGAEVVAASSEVPGCEATNALYESPQLRASFRRLGDGSGFASFGDSAQRVGCGGRSRDYRSGSRSDYVHLAPQSLGLEMNWLGAWAGGAASHHPAIRGESSFMLLGMGRGIYGFFCAARQRSVVIGGGWSPNW